MTCYRIDNPNRWDAFRAIVLGERQIAFFDRRGSSVSIKCVSIDEAAAMFRNEVVERTNVTHDSVHK